MSKQPQPAPTASTIGPCPTVIQVSRTTRQWMFTQRLRTNRPPPGQTEPPVEYRGPNAAEHFLESLQEEKSKIKGVLADPKAMRMTREDWLAFRTAKTCHVCDKPLESDSVRDHCHITGEYRGAAHNACNLKLRLNPKTTSIPVVFHNLRGYYSYLADAGHLEGGGQGELYPQQHREVYLFLPRTAALH